MPKIGIVIPYFRNREALDKCLEHLKAQTLQDHEVFVRDNSEDNILFTAAVNEGLEHFVFKRSAEYVLVLNQDAYLEPDALANLYRFMEANPGCGIAGAIQVKQDWSVFWAGGLAAFPRGKHKQGELGEFLQPAETYWANGACMMIRNAVVREIGLFDKNMRFICSDADYSFTARARGWTICVVPDAICQHEAGDSGSARIAELELVKHQDLLYFYGKWLDGAQFRSLALEGATLTTDDISNARTVLINGIQTLRHTLESTLRAS